MYSDITEDGHKENAVIKWTGVVEKMGDIAKLGNEMLEYSSISTNFKACVTYSIR